MAIATSTALLIGAAVSAAGAVYSVQQQKKSASEARDAQERAANEAKALNQAASDKAAAEAAASERDKNRLRAGRSSTVLTGLTGDTSTASTATKTLLGG